MIIITMAEKLLMTSLCISSIYYGGGDIEGLAHYCEQRNIISL